MAEYLVFRLYGPLCSWGEIAVGESRHTADHPSRSALLGLFAAALGIERSAENDHAALSEAWRFGVKLLAPGMLLRDYHTVQAPGRQKNVRHRTRRSELCSAGVKVNTLLSTREYRTDSVSMVAAELKQEGRWTLRAMQHALERPCFPLYLGRKSCPPALPMAPQVVDVTTLRDALDSDQLPLAGLCWGSPAAPRSEDGQRTQEWPAPADRRSFRMDAARYFWEDGMALEATGPDAQSRNYIDFVRNDQPLSRRRWQFARRRERSFLAASSAQKDGEA